LAEEVGEAVGVVVVVSVAAMVGVAVIVGVAVTVGGGGGEVSRSDTSAMVG
jgi:hypothetical protein